MDEITSSLGVARLATFPEENPNLVIEMLVDGRVTYLNPEAQSRFPTLRREGGAHPLLAPAVDLVRGLDLEQATYLPNEVRVGDAIFEQKVCYTPLDAGVYIRIYAHDITALREAEEALHHLTHEIVNAQEAERARLSRELHDEAGQALTALKIGLDLMKQDMDDGPQAVIAGLTDAIALVDETRERIRRMAHGLRPPALDVGGVAVALDELGREFSRRTRIDVDVAKIAPVTCSEATAICLYRVMQEALTNVAEHAEAANVVVTLEELDGQAVLAVTDDGRGIDVATSHGIGLAGMRERVEMLGGSLIIAKDGGARVEARVPLP